MPLWADKLLRMTYLAKAQGDTTVREAMDRLNFVARATRQKIILHETSEGWTSSAEDIESLAA